MKNRILGLLLANCLVFHACSLHAEEPVWLKCRLEPVEKQLECYQGITESYLAGTASAEKPALATAEEIAPDPDWKLDQLWPLPNELGSKRRLANTFMQYKQNYLLLDAIYSPSDSPSSPNPLNQSPTGKRPQTSELKYQISLKAQMPFTWPWGDTLWFAYTQQSRWQAFKSSDSRPFRESNYEPEMVFLSHRFKDVPVLPIPLVPRFLNLSYIHQSNGQTLPRSRSWNRLAAQIGSEYRFTSVGEEEVEKRIAILVRPWWRVPENDAKDDNPDITRFLGHGDVEINYWRGRDLYAVLLRKRAVQLDWSFPLTESANTLSLHLQYFNGYGESLIDYNHKLHSFGIGLSLPY